MDAINRIPHYIGQDEERAAWWWMFEISQPAKFWNFEQMQRWGF